MFANQRNRLPFKSDKKTFASRVFATSLSSKNACEPHERYYLLEASYHNPLPHAVSSSSSMRTSRVHNSNPWLSSGSLAPWRKSQYSSPHMRLTAKSAQFSKICALRIQCSANWSNSVRFNIPQAYPTRKCPIHSLISQAR